MGPHIGAPSVNGEGAAPGQVQRLQVVQVAAKQREFKPQDAAEQVRAVARQHECWARSLAAQALKMRGAAAFNSAALATHHARQAVALMRGGAHG